MLKVHLAELRDSWSAWAGVSLTFIAVNWAVVLQVIIGYSGIVMGAAGKLNTMATSSYVTNLLLVGMLCVLTAVPVISASTSLVVNSRRGSLARLALVGAAPAQVRGTVVGQLAIVSLVCGLVGDALAIGAATPWMRLTDYQARDEDFWVSIDPVISWWPILAANLAIAVVCVVAGAKQATRASTIPPIEALRQSQAPVPDVRLRGGSRVVIGLLVVAMIGSVAAARYIATLGTVSVIGHLVILGFFQLFFWAGLLSVIAPVLVAPVTRLWTRVPVPSATWHLARATVSARADRLYKSVIPVMFAFAIGVGVLVYVDSALASLKVSEAFMELTMPGLDSIVLLFGPSFVIAFSAGVGSLLMMSRQRDAELALTGIVGGTPAQRVAIPLAEAFMITVSAFLLSLIVIVPTLLFEWFVFSIVGASFVLDVSPVVPVGFFVGGFALTALSTVLPTLPAQRHPEPRVISRLVAE